MSANGFAVREVSGLVEMVITGRWSEGTRIAFEANKADRLVLNYALGFDEPDLEFLRGLRVRELVVLDRRLQSLAPVYALADSLRSLRVTTNPAMTIDLGRLPNVRMLAADWSQIARSLTTADATYEIEDLFLRAFTEADLTALSNVQGLSQLILKDRPRLKSLHGLSDHKNLHRLEVALASSLANVAELRHVTGIEVLQLEGCRRLDAIDDLSSCQAIHTLNIGDCGNIRTLRPLVEMTKLRVLHAYGTTNIVDGDLGPILNLTALEDFRMQDRRSYRPRVAEIQRQIAQREL